ncbi:hypothetical protein ACGFZP_13140 [Kitasatospora sp. NPDC048239]|uniref:hypothetical protein n=1 Tax=Kitasatospora sp. NPDC048239 TaxID=3364046 RepID=UPI0037136D9D
MASQQHLIRTVVDAVARSESAYRADAAADATYSQSVADACEAYKAAIAAGVNERDIRALLPATIHGAARSILTPSQRAADQALADLRAAL